MKERVTSGAAICRLGYDLAWCRLVDDREQRQQGDGLMGLGLGVDV